MNILLFMPAFIHLQSELGSQPRLQSQTSGQSIVEDHLVAGVVLCVAGQSAGQLEGDDIVDIVVSGVVPCVVNNAVVFAVFDILDLLLNGGQCGLGSDGEGVLTLGVDHDQRVCFVAGQSGNICDHPVALRDVVIGAGQIGCISSDASSLNCAVQTVCNLTHGQINITVVALLVGQILHDLIIGNAGCGSGLGGAFPEVVAAVVENFGLEDFAVLISYGVRIVVAVAGVITGAGCGVMLTGLQTGGQFQQPITLVGSACGVFDGELGVCCKSGDAETEDHCQCQENGN